MSSAQPYGSYFAGKEHRGPLFDARCDGRATTRGLRPGHCLPQGTAQDCDRRCSSPLHSIVCPTEPHHTTPSYHAIIPRHTLHSTPLLTTPIHSSPLHSTPLRTARHRTTPSVLPSHRRGCARKVGKARRRQEDGRQSFCGHNQGKGV